MSNLAATILQDLRINSPLFDKNNVARRVYGALDFFQDQTDAPNSIITPEMATKAFSSIGQDVKIPVLNYDSSVTVSSSRSCTISADDNESALYSVTFATYSVGFTMIPTLYHNNEITYQRDIERKMEKASRALANALDGAAVTALSNAKTQVMADSLLYTFSSNEVSADWDAREGLLSDLDVMMMANGYNGQLNIIGNAGVKSVVNKLAQFGEYNAQNKHLEYDNKKFYTTTGISNASNKFATLYAVEDGNCGILRRVDREALAGSSANSHEWGVTELPFVGQVGYHYYTEVGDVHTAQSAGATDMVCNVTEYWGFSVDVAFITAYNSAAASLANPFIKATIATAGSGVNPFAVPVKGNVIVGNTNATPLYTVDVTPAP